MKSSGPERNFNRLASQPIQFSYDFIVHVRNFRVPSTGTTRITVHDGRGGSARKPAALEAGKAEREAGIGVRRAPGEGRERRGGKGRGEREARGGSPADGEGGPDEPEAGPGGGREGEPAPANYSREGGRVRRRGCT